MLHMICAISLRSVTAITGIVSARKESILWKERGLSDLIRQMETLPEVETAKALMTEAMTWSVMKWLREKKRVRKTADLANAVLDQASQSVRERWPEPIRTAYEAMVTQTAGTVSARRHQAVTVKTDPAATLTASKSREADDEAYRAHIDAEKVFDEAERKLSTSLAREGCRKAIHSWDLHEKAIRKAEAFIRPK
jgi:hypothetical protein